jgi:hypothetical protein
MLVFVEAAVLDDTLLDQYNAFANIKDKLMTFRDGKDDLTDKIDFIICLGGDGTLLYASHLFQQSVPPVMAFHLGSLGFLTPFQFDNFQEQVNNVLEGNAALTLRSRLRCIVMRKGDDEKKTAKQPTNLLGAERGGGRQGTVAVPLQHRPVPRREAHHVGARGRLDRQHPDGEHRVRGGCGRLHDTPQRAGHHGHAHLPPLVEFQAHRGAGGSGIEGEKCSDWLTRYSLDRVVLPSGNSRTRPLFINQLSSSFSLIIFNLHRHLDIGLSRQSQHFVGVFRRQKSPRVVAR